MNNDIKILVACEESQRVCLAFRQRGFEAYSCDIQKCSGGFPQFHIQGNVLDYIYDDWDCVIAFPPCTYLTKAGACNLFIGNNGVIRDFKREQRGWEARDFFMKFYNLKTRVAIENPTPMNYFNLPPVDYVIQPHEFGEPYSKRTCLWLRGLPGLFATSYITDFTPTTKANWYTNCNYQYRQRARSRTFNGVALAMAKQWGDFLLFKQSIGELKLS